LPPELGLFGYKTDEDGGKIDATKGRSASQTVEEIVESLFDDGDPNKPDFSPAAAVGGVIMMVGAPSASQFNTLVEAFNKVFGIKDWKDWLDRQKRRFEKSSKVPGVVTQTSTDSSGIPPTGRITDGRQNINDVPDNAYIRMLTGASRGQVYRIKSAQSGGADTLPENERIEGNSGVIFTVDPIPFGTSQNRRNFDQILANLKSDLGQEITPPTQDALQKLAEDSFSLFNAIRSGVKGDHYSIEVGTFDSIEPDWSKLPLTQVFILLAPLFEAMDKLLDVLGPAKQASTAILELVELINQKVQAFTDLVASLQQILQDITDALGATGFHILVIPGATGGIDNLVNRVRTADNLPPFGSGDYTAAVTVLAGGPNLDALLGLFS